MKYVSLFAGIGGFDLALERLGHECVYANDFDKYCKITYDRHFKTRLDTRSITGVSTEEIPDHDLLVGGFPCQSFSIAGRRGGFSDTRGTLFFEIARILKAKRPTYLLLENVKGLLSHDNGRTFETIMRTLDELGYECQWQVLNSKNFGVPQNRERVFIIGHTRGTRRPEVFPIRSNDETYTNKGTSLTANTLTANYWKGPAASRPLVYVGGVLSEKQKLWLKDGKTLSRNFPQGQRIYSAEGISTTLASQSGGLGAKTGLYIVGNPRGKNKGYKGEIAPTITGSDYQHNNHVVIPVISPDRVNKRQNGRRFKEDGDPAFTLTAQDRHGILYMNNAKNMEYVGQDNRIFSDEGISPALSVGNNFGKFLSEYKIRKLTPIEAERLQGFPDGWTEGVSDTQRYKQMGNAVTVNVVEEIVKFL